MKHTYISSPFCVSVNSNGTLWMTNHTLVTNLPVKSLLELFLTLVHLGLEVFQLGALLTHLIAEVGQFRFKSPSNFLKFLSHLSLQGHKTEIRLHNDFTKLRNFQNLASRVNSWSKLELSFGSLVVSFSHQFILNTVVPIFWAYPRLVFHPVSAWEYLYSLPKYIESFTFYSTKL